MSAIAEALGFGREADAIERRLVNEPGLTVEERATLESRMRWYRTESDNAWAAARAEGLSDADDERGES